MELEVTHIKQKDTDLYLSWLPAEELIKRGRVDTWTPGHTDGYQRVLMPKRVGEVAWYLKEAEGIMPTSVLISIRSDIKPDKEKRRLDIPDETILWIIDGQHRVAGLARAIEQGEQELNGYPLPVVIMVNPNKFDEMRAFYLVNSRAKSVPTDVAERILQRTMAQRGESWIREHEAEEFTKSQKAINQAKATEVVDHLRSESAVWKGMIAVPGEPKPNVNAVKQHTMVMAMLEGAFKDATLANLDPRALGELLARYWDAIKETWPEAFAEPKLYSVLKSSGVWSLNMLFRDVFERCRESKDYSNAKMVELLRSLAVGSEFWCSSPDKGDPRTFGSSLKAIRLLHAFLREQLPKLTLAGL
jgi:DGQHR domain-containing protein